MNLRKIRFWSTEEQLMLYTKVSCVSAFGHYLNVPQMPGFSDIDTTPRPERYIPMVFTGKTDCDGKEIWEGDLIALDFPMFTGSAPGKIIKCVVVYDETEAMFGLKPLEVKDNSATVPFIGLKKEIKVLGELMRRKKAFISSGEDTVLAAEGGLRTANAAFPISCAGDLCGMFLLIKDEDAKPGETQEHLRLGKLASDFLSRETVE